MDYKELWSIFKRTLSSNTKRIQLQYRDEFIVDVLEINLYREKLISIILLILNISLIYVDIHRSFKLWPNMAGYLYLLYAHTFMMIFLPIHLLLMHLRNREVINRNVKFDKALHHGFVSIALVWCAILSVNAQLIHKQISAYIIGMYSVASLFIMAPLESLIIYLVSYTIFIIGIIALPNDPQSLNVNIVNSLLLIILAYVISRITFSSQVQEFINRKVIIEKNKELDNSHRSLEEIVNKRTNELKNANKLLIEEINKRHEAEIQAIKSMIMYEEKAKRLNQAMEYDNLRASFFATLSHELKTPLNVIFSAQQMMDNIIKKGKIDDSADKLNKYIGVIRQNCYRLIRIIRNLIDITKIDANYFQIEFKNCDIIKVVEDITMSVAEYIESKDINLVFDTNVEEKIISCDPEKVERIMLNLLSNAVKFTPKGGSIYVSMKEDKDKVFVSVKDTGLGISKEMQAKIFEKFVQVNESKDQNKDGSGIGLSLVKSLMELHQGQVAVSSDVGSGSEFILEFPDVKLDTEKDNKNTSEETKDDKIEKITIEFSDIYFD